MVVSDQVVFHHTKSVSRKKMYKITLKDALEVIRRGQVV